MPERYSIAQARQNLAALVHEVERKTHIELTRRGKPVAVLVSMREYQRLSAQSRGFWKVYEAYRRAVDLAGLRIEPGDFDGLRSRSAGRDVRL